MDKQKVLEKIKKCLALGESANEHEAAQAIRQAQILMKKYGISEMDVELSAVTEKGVPVAATLPTWHQILISQCAKAFGVKSYQYTQWGLAEARFFGIGIKPELAAYAYEVLLRQLKKERREYIKNELKAVRLSRNKTARADQFCTGWVYAISRKVQEFAAEPAEEEVLARYKQQLGEMEKAPKRDVHGGSKASREQDLAAGVRKGREAQLYHAMDGAEDRKQLGLNG
ncbi:DUF2786 domain-containing protein [Eikenella corrodens]|uniref:DUF2786 domain-containing protein n=1 Tax=Eikenella corrodens TaxID=539 RepID=UPI0006684CB0|nr:DUF2786 domain-containing protein [Eikenella corrodens]